MRDSKGRDINYLRLSVTDRCNIRCIYCMPESGIPLVSHDDILSVDETIRLCGIIMKAADITKVRITGGEPLVRKGVLDIVGGISDLNPCELVLTTNGLLLRSMAKQLADAGIERVNISLDSLKDDRISRISRRDVSLHDIEEAVAAAFDAGLGPVKVNCVVMRDINDDEIGDFIRWSGETGVTVRFIEHMPSRLPEDTFVSRDEIIERASARGEIVRQIDDGTAGIYSFGNNGQTFGIIAPFSDPMCNSCSRIRLSALGTLHSCLAKEEGISLKELLRNDAGDEIISDMVRRAVINKPDSHGGCVQAKMWKIGG
ncbi:GTP 3',8-cyclase MoaA [Candidatus Fermentibacteria bacterium]|nr:MAG: GTP 3',8-cyclase MoaA [Candidatus Fermentibacteria bacterium]